MMNQRLWRRSVTIPATYLTHLIRSISQDMATVFYARTDSRFIKTKNNLGRKNLVTRNVVKSEKKGSK